MVGLQVEPISNLFYQIEFELLQIDEGRFPFLPVLPLLQLVVLDHGLYFTLPPAQNNIMPGGGDLPLPNLPIIPPCIQPLPPTLADHPLHLRLQIVSNTPYTQIGYFLLRVYQHFNVVVTEILVGGVLLNGGETFDGGNFPEETVAVGLGNQYFPSDFRLFVFLFHLLE